MKPTLLIMAAGMGSRYGGLKQLDPVGPNGETLLEYSIYDAIKAGFGKVVFVIRHDFEDAFKEQVGSKFTDKIDVQYAFQSLENSALATRETSVKRQASSFVVGKPISLKSASAFSLSAVKSMTYSSTHEA